MTNRYGLYILGYTCTTMVKTELTELETVKKQPKLRSQFGLSTETRRHEVGFGSNLRVER